MAAVDEVSPEKTRALDLAMTMLALTMAQVEDPAVWANSLRLYVDLEVDVFHDEAAMAFWRQFCSASAAVFEAIAGISETGE